MSKPQIMFLRHGQAAADPFGIDFLRALSEVGKQQAAAVKLPFGFDTVIVSPAVRAVETAKLSTGRSALIAIPSIYAPILLPEMDEMYTTHGDNVRGYMSDKNISNTLQITKQAADEILTHKNNLIVVGHGLILNLIAHHIYDIDQVFDINLGPAKGFAIHNGNLIEF